MYVKAILIGCILCIHERGIEVPWQICNDIMRCSIISIPREHNLIELV